MKKINFLMVLTILFFSLVSCQDNDFTESQINESEDRNFSEFSTNSIYGITIDNGETSNSKNNILVFESSDIFKQTSIELERKRENHIDMMNNSVDPNMTDEDYRNHIESIKFDEDQAYIDFEQQYEFYSLRKEINKRELEWLSRRTDEEDWDEVLRNDPDPDDSFVWEEERSFLNPQFEVIIKDELGANIIYKLYPNGNYAKIRNMNEMALKLINRVGPIQHVDIEWFVEEDPLTGGYGNMPPSAQFPGPGYGYGDITTIDDSNNSDNCIRKNTYFSKRIEFKKRRRIKVIQSTRHNTFFYNPRVKATTRYYHKFGVWRPTTSLIGAELHTNYPISCDHMGLLPDPVYNYKRVHRVSAVWNANDIGAKYVPYLTPDNTYSQYRRLDYLIEIDFYTREINQLW